VHTNIQLLLFLPYTVCMEHPDVLLYLVLTHMDRLPALNPSSIASVDARQDRLFMAPIDFHSRMLAGLRQS